MNQDFDWNAVDGTAQDAIQFSAPIVFWKHGKQGMQKVGGIEYTGGFFFTFDEAGENAEIAKWEHASFTNDEGKEIEGLAARGAQITIVRSRRRWFREDGNRRIFRPWNQYNDGYRGQMQSIGFINGYPVPVCFSVKGLLLTHFDEVIRYHNSKVVSIANQTAPEGRKLPAYALWMAIHAGKHSKAGQGNKQSEVTWPELWLPKVLDLDYARKMYVGKDQLTRSQALYRELDDWAQQWSRAAVETAESPLGAEDYAVEREARQSRAATVHSSQPPSYDDAPPLEPPDYNSDSIPF